MILARVVGTVVATRKDEKMTGQKLQIVQPISLTDMAPDGKPLVAVDAVGAGVGEIVMVCAGSSARQTARTKDTPCDAVIMAIIDSLDVEGRRVFDKSGG
ncbi:MAG TPA: EutN/CcmL family microcompartment protein [Symbiobacteriaceae bacterium]|nr:EutN/CcmL family microcompartment protein [Symbiobacteriaceae bacterium]